MSDTEWTNCRHEGKPARFRIRWDEQEMDLQIFEDEERTVVKEQWLYRDVYLSDYKESYPEDSEVVEQKATISFANIVLDDI